MATIWVCWILCDPTRPLHRGTSQMRAGFSNKMSAMESTRWWSQKLCIKVAESTWPFRSNNSDHTSTKLPTKSPSAKRIFRRKKPAWNTRNSSIAIHGIIKNHESAFYYHQAHGWLTISLRICLVCLCRSGRFSTLFKYSRTLFIHSSILFITFHHSSSNSTKNFGS